MEFDIQNSANYDIQSTASYYSGGNSERQVMQTNAKDNVKVIIRIRPFNEKEKSISGGPKKCVSVENESTVVLEARPDYKVFNFDFVGDEDLEQKTIFDSIAKPIADCCLQGYNGSIFAYGQTGSGKTFTIQGPGININGDDKASFTLNKDKQDYEKRGLMPRSFEYIFECIERAKIKASEQNDHFEYLIRCTYLEIYNEQIIDLLEPGSFNLHLREDIKKGVYVEGLLEENVQNEHDMMALIARGAKNRHMGSTSMNKESSRSHSVLTTIIETKSMSQSGVWNLKTSRFHIIDLAGSERAKHTNAIGERLKEAGMINKSLSALGNVINSLVDISEGKNRHVHYRDSKLTFLLRDSLGGNSKTVIIANISPSSLNSGETLSTLKFAQRAKLIKNKAVINEDSSGTIQLLKTEINRLKKELAESEQRHQLTSQQCLACKNNIHSGTNKDDMINDDSLVIEGLNEDLELFNSSITNGVVSDVLKQKYIDSKQENAKTKKRIVYLESLLSANLDTMTGQQKFYEQEVQKSQLLVKKYQQSLESYEKQSSRDKMIIKFREDRITKLEENLPQTIEDKHKLINEYKKEIALLKESADHNPQTAKLFAEKAELIQQLNQLKKELNMSPDSLHAQIRSLSELNESLNEYLKQYCEGSKKDFESEINRLKQVQNQQAEEFHKSIEELLVKEQQYQEKYTQIQKQWILNAKQQKQKSDEITKKFQEEKIQLEQIHKEQLDQLKIEIEQINENKNQKESTAQMLKIEIAEKQNEYQKLASQLNETIELQTIQIQQQLKQEQDFKDQIAEQQLLVEEIKQQKSDDHNQLLQVIESEKKRNQASYKHAEEQWLKKLKEQEKEMLDAQNEKQIIDQQCAELDNRLSGLVSNNETLKQSLMFKEEELLENQRLMKSMEEQVLVLQSEINEEKQRFEVMIIQKSQEIEQLCKEINNLQNLKNQTQQSLDQNIELNKSIQKNINDLTQKIKKLETDQSQESQNYDIMISKINVEKENLNSHIKELELSSLQLGQQIENLTTESQLYKSQSQNEILVLKETYENKLEILSSQNQQSQQQHQDSLKQHQFQIEELNAKNDKIETSLNAEIRQLQDQNQQQIKDNDNKISELLKNQDSQVYILNQTFQQKQEELIKHNEQQQIVSNNKHQEEINLLRQEIEQLEANFQKRLYDNENSNINNINELTNKSEQEKRVIQNDYEQKIASLLKSNEDKFRQSQVDHSEEVQQLQISHQRQLQELSVQIQQKIEDLEVHNNQLINEQQNTHKKIMEEKQDQFQAKLDELIQKCQQKDTEIQQLIDQNKNEILALRQVTSNETTQRLQLLEQSKDQDIQSINNKFNLQLVELNSQIKKWQEKLAQIQIMHKEEIKTLNQQIAERDNTLKSITSSSEESVGSLSQQILTLQQYLEQKTKEYKQEADDKKQMIKILEDDLQVKDSHIQNLQSQLSLFETKMKDLNETLSQKEVAGIHQQLKITQLNEQIYGQIEQQSLYVGNIQQLETELSEKLTQLNNLNQNYSQIESHSQDVEEQLQQKQKEVVQMRINTQDLQNQLNELQNQNLILEKQLEQNTHDNQQLHNEVLQQDKNFDELKLEYQNLKNQDKISRESYDQTIAEKTSEINNLHQQIRQNEYEFNSQILNLNQYHEENINSLQSQYEKSINDVREELQQQINSNEILNQQYQELNQTCAQFNQTIKQNKEAIKNLKSIESSLVIDIENKTNEYNVSQEKWRISLQESKDKRDQLKKEQDKIKKENDNLRELVKLKDRQLDDLKGYDEMDKGNLDKIKKENKDLRTQVTKREFEMKEVVRTLKFYSEEKSRMEKELEKLHRENDQLIGHKNPSQKIQHHLKIKEENNKLREDNYKLLEDLRKKETLLQKIMKSGGKDMAAFQSHGSNSQFDTLENQNNEKAQKEFHNGIAKVIEHIIVQPGLNKILGLNEENLERIQQQSSILKLKNIIDIISLLNNTLISKERDIKDLMNDKKRLEDKYDILEQEKNLINQQLDFKSNNHRTSMSQDQNMIVKIEPVNQQAQTARANFREQRGDEISNNSSNSLEINSTLASSKQQSSTSKLQIFIQQPPIDKQGSTSTSSVVSSMNQTKPTSLPLGCLRLLKEKENVQQKKDTTSTNNGSISSNRGGSSRRSAYLSNTNK